MPSKLREWFDELGHLNHLDKKDITLQRAFAVVIYHVINADKVETEKEKKRFSSFFKNDFSLDDLEIDQLHREASQFDKDFDTYLDVLKEKIGAYPEVELKLMQTLNSIMVTEGFNEKEFFEFEKIRDALF
ncbi:TerB family tellurite resistance protein [Cocleimonas sp. KMM 6892]|uniref:TerB family tellurite resistance protein n=1 Tax=unclassified Cocleimonas TaxID=2639732 RepID=UPI002DB65F4F|nr:MULTISPECIES: TerB family tellurite resistance protein [unclassified Cocleimonas]MEB8432957.1 TerB family tellurite resistance protein [Cocleimonas sp. KMM 6892]MEC4716062.1 TerB family tellurite resistance protein [Cocleimonas sp. KMM 6895]MEC4745523.1 TerB family tellurite resistance protein [Cocleimonas sp. KMM 6896]